MVNNSITPINGRPIANATSSLTSPPPIHPRWYMTNSSANRIVAAISDPATCIGLANCPAIPSNASTRQISFLINRVAISIVATYSNNTISRNEAVGAIQFMKSRPQKNEGTLINLKWGHIKNIKKWRGTFRCPLRSQIAVLHGGSEASGDGGDPARQRRPDGTTSSRTERSSHCADDASRDDNVLERHHAFLIRTQVLQGFGGLNIIVQHRRKSFLQDEPQLLPLADIAVLASGVQSKWEAHSDAPLRVRSPNYTAAVNLVVIAVIPPDSAVPMAPVAPVPNAAATAPMIQAATIMYSNDTTPSWSLAKVFTLFRNLRMLNASKLMLSFKIQFQWCGSSPDHHGV